MEDLCSQPHSVPLIKVRAITRQHKPSDIQFNPFKQIFTDPQKGAQGVRQGPCLGRGRGVG